MLQMVFDLNGSSTTATSSYLSRGPLAVCAETDVYNTSTAGHSQIGNATCGQMGVYVESTANSDIEFTANDSSSTSVGAAAFTTWMDFNAAAGSTVSIPNVHHFMSNGTSAYGSGTKTITNSYDFYAKSNPGTSDITNEYAFYSEDKDKISAVGKLESYREKQNALTSSTTIAVDAAAAPVHTVTLAHSTQFAVSNLGTGQTITLILRQDGTGSRTATFSEADSTAIKFAGGSKTLSTAASAIDVVTIYNDGTDMIANLAKAYA